jgi:hypothetical protein
MTRRRKKRNKIRSLYLWHKYIGLTAAVFVFLLCLTGMALNHTGDLKLGRHYISANWLLDHYNVSEPSIIKSFPLKKKPASQVDDSLFIGEHYVGSIEREMVGALDFYGMIIVALKGQLLLLDDNLTIIEEFGRADGVPILLQGIGYTSANQLTFKTPTQTLTVDDAFIEWSEMDNSIQTQWSAPIELSKSQQQSLSKHYRAHIIRLESLVLDLHSGRFFGRYGVFFFDFIAITLMFLAATGIWIWLRQKAAHKKK